MAGILKRQDPGLGERVRRNPGSNCISRTQGHDGCVSNVIVLLIKSAPDQSGPGVPLMLYSSILMCSLTSLSECMHSHQSGIDQKI